MFASADICSKEHTEGKEANGSCILSSFFFFPEWNSIENLPEFYLENQIVSGVKYHLNILYLNNHLNIIFSWNLEFSWMAIKMTTLTTLSTQCPFNNMSVW